MANNKINPLFRGIYYLYLNNLIFPLYYNDPDARAELISIAHLLNMDADWRSMILYRHLFVRELVERNG